MGDKFECANCHRVFKEEVLMASLVSCSPEHKFDPHILDNKRLCTACRDSRDEAVSKAIAEWGKQPIGSNWPL